LVQVRLGLSCPAAGALHRTEPLLDRLLHGRARPLPVVLEVRNSFVKPSQFAADVRPLLVGLVLDVELYDPVRDGRRPLGACPLKADCDYTRAALLHDLQAALKFVEAQPGSISAVPPGKRSNPDIQPALEFPEAQRSDFGRDWLGGRFRGGCRIGLARPGLGHCPSELRVLQQTVDDVLQVIASGEHRHVSVDGLLDRLRADENGRLRLNDDLGLYSILGRDQQTGDTSQYRSERGHHENQSASPTQDAG